MKIITALIVLVSGFTSMATATTINATNRPAYAANLGWTDWRGDTNSGGVIGEYVCSGCFYAANVGWIHLGNNAPKNGIQYQNSSASDYGVNHDGSGNLRGYAYGANIGWIQFESNGAPRIDLKTGKLSGSIYSANCGWISLSNAFAHIQTDILAPGEDTDGDGIADAWERLKFGTTTSANASSDTDHDGQSDLQEYLTDTNPNDAADTFIITDLITTSGGALTTVTWKSALTRCYAIEQKADLSTAAWFDSSLGIIYPDGAATTRTFAGTNAPMRFYRVQVIKPLSP